MTSRLAALTAGLLVLASASTSAVPLLRMAESRIEFQSPTACGVSLTVEVVERATVEHRVEVVDGARVDLVAVDGATVADGPRDVGRTRALHLMPVAAMYTLRYSVVQPGSRAGRCPMWLPAIPSDGRSRNVQLRVRVPEGSEVGATMPSFEWTGAEGTARLSHLPAFVHVPFSEPGAAPPTDVARLMDIVAIATLAAASAAWAFRRGRGQARLRRI